MVAESESKRVLLQWNARCQIPVSEARPWGRASLRTLPLLTRGLLTHRPTWYS